MNNNKLFCLLFLAFTNFAFAQSTADFENFNLQNESYLNGDDENGGFQSANVFLVNDYNPGYMSWIGFAISNTTDVTTPGFMNGFSAITGGGVNNSPTYAISFVFGESKALLTGDASGESVSGIYVANGTYAYLSMQDGDSFAKKFGGVTGDDPDYFLLTIKKYYNGVLAQDSVDFYLADYRFEDNSMDYIVDDWTYVDLSSLGPVDSLSFTLSSTDTGIYGMNTPAYFCIDNLTTTDGTTSIFEKENSLSFDLFPNPASDHMVLRTEIGEGQYRIFDLLGKAVSSGLILNNETKVGLTKLAKGIYLVEVAGEEGTGSRLFVVE